MKRRILFFLTTNLIMMVIGIALMPALTAEAAGPWSPTGSMSTIRFDGTAALLPNEKVLVAGGTGANGIPLATAELYDPQTGTWSPTGSMSVGRSFHTATLLQNGEVLVVGGEIPGNLLATAEVYDPQTGTWSSVGNMLEVRAGHNATLLSDGRVLVSGGLYSSPTLTATELYNPHTRMWSQTGSMSSPRFNFTTTLLPNGQVLAAGGFSTSRNWGVLQTAEFYNPQTGQWSPTANMIGGHAEHIAVRLFNGQVLVAGGLGLGNLWQTGAELYSSLSPTGG